MNVYSNFAFLFIFFFFLLLTHFGASEIDPEYLLKQCPTTTTFKRNNTYYANLRTFLSSLSSSNTSYAFGFWNATVGRNPDEVTGLFLCRGDLSPEVCRLCTILAVNDALIQCPNQKEVSIWYIQCMLRYSNRNILSALNTDGFDIIKNDDYISSSLKDRFRDVLLSTMSQAANEAADNSRKFSSKNENFTPFQTIYGLAQCTHDLTKQECRTCLQYLINRLPHDKISGHLFVPSCYLWYQIHAFDNGAVQTNPPQQPLQTLSAAPPQLPPQSTRKGGKSSVIISAVVVPAVVSVMLFIAGCCLYTRKGRKTSHPAAGDDSDEILTADSLELDFKTIEIATENFAESNKLGQGGFGKVYKGRLTGGTEVAVKRLSKSSGQGEREFKNEVVLVAKLQHRNLVRLLGFCLEGLERILVYEFVPNRSLDYFLFCVSDPTTESLMNWARRYKIIEEIARGILYLHQDSRITIIHRDLKASNILLDADMNPKVADFGMAKIFGVDQTRADTKRIVGTLGYMAPEYAMYGRFSMRSDVYSFGILVLEIISGKKNSSFYQIDGAGNLVTYVWRLWRSGSSLELVDPTIQENCQRNEVIRCIHIGLLCVQEDAEDRPTMPTIILMLTSNTVTLPVPKQPGFFFRTRREEDPPGKEVQSDQSTSKSFPGSVDSASITELGPR